MKFWIKTCFLVLLVSCSHTKVNTKSNTADAENPHLITHCQIFSYKGQMLRNFPGFLCSYDQLGNVVSEYKGTLLFFNKFGRVDHRIDRVFGHHQLNRDSKGNVLVMGSQIEKFEGKRVRMDTLNIISPDGKVLKHLSFGMLRNAILKNCTLSNKLDPFFFSTEESKEADTEFLHVNSFYQIPDQTRPGPNPFFKAGNFIVNSKNSSHIFILDSGLKSIIQFIPKSQDMNDIPILHDVHPTKDGRIISYMNYSPTSPQLSAIWIHDSSFEKKLFEYKRSTPRPFFSDHSGGVHFFSDESFIFSEMIEGEPVVSHVDRSGKTISTIKLKLPKLYKGIMQIKSGDLSGFMENNPGF